MPTLSDPAIGQHATVVTGIYIARGDQTLGPYNSLEAAALIVGGYLHADDHAARNGDSLWVSLSDFLPRSVLTPAAKPMPVPDFAAPTATTHPHRWRHLAVAFVVLLAAPLIVAGGMHWFGFRRADEHPPALPLPRPVQVTNISAPMPAADLLPTPQAPPPAPVADGPVHGLVARALRGEGQAPFAGVRVSIYPLAALEASLAPINAETQAARVRLDPQVEAAATERSTRTAEAQAALQALREADPAGPLLPSLRFANAGAKAAAKTAEDDYRYVLGERNAVAGGEVYYRVLPEPTLTTDTDAQGHFTLPLPPGDEPYAVAACAREAAEDGPVLLRYWVVRLSPAQRSGREGVRLDGGNVSSSTAAESLIHTAD